MHVGRTGRVGGRGKRLDRVERAMIRIMNQHNEPIALMQKIMDCQRNTVLAVIHQIRRKKDDVSKDYDVLRDYVDFVNKYPPEKGGGPVGVPLRNARHDIKWPVFIRRQLFQGMLLAGGPLKRDNQRQMITASMRRSPELGARGVV